MKDTAAVRVQWCAVSDPLGVDQGQAGVIVPDDCCGQHVAAADIVEGHGAVAVDVGQRVGVVGQAAGRAGAVPRSWGAARVGTT